MREITLWRLVFGLAFVPAALVVRADLDTSAGASLLERLAAFAIAYLVSLVLSALVVGFGVWAYLTAWRVRSFAAELLGL